MVDLAAVVGIAVLALGGMEQEDELLLNQFALVTVRVGSDTYTRDVRIT